MTKALIACLLLATLLLSACPRDDYADEANDPPQNVVATSAPEEMPEDAPVAVDLVARGKEIFSGTEYSNTGLTCAHCHASSPADEAGGKLIGHTAYGAMSRGSWKHTDQAQLDARAGKAATLLDAANFCVGAPYMDHKHQLIEGQDGEALGAYMASISDPTAWDAQPFVMEMTRSMPVAGLTPDLANGERIYENTCERCHEGFAGIANLHGLGEWMNPMQLMAKIRKMPDWFETYEDAKYASLSSHDTNRVVAWMLGSTAAHAQEGNPCGENPCGENPCGGQNPCGEAEGDSDAIFAVDAMPFFASDILSDQDVVDVAHFLMEHE